MFRTTPRRVRPDGPELSFALTEMALAKRWGRAHNTLSGWRTRPTPGMKPLQWQVIDGVVYYDKRWILRYEADQLHAPLRPARLRGLPFPPLESPYIDAPVEVQAELPLPLGVTAEDVTAAQIEQVLGLTESEQPVAPRWINPLKDRRFKSLTICAGYALAIATDDTAWYAEVLGGLQFAAWKSIPALPQDDFIASLFARRAA